MGKLDAAYTLNPVRGAANRLIGAVQCVAGIAGQQGVPQSGSGDCHLGSDTIMPTPMLPEGSSDGLEAHFWEDFGAGRIDQINPVDRVVF
jgi:hypothetical protein